MDEVNVTGNTNHVVYREYATSSSSGSSCRYSEEIVYLLSKENVSMPDFVLNL